MATDIEKAPEALQQLVAEADTGGAQAGGRHGQGDLRRRARLGAVPALVRLAAAVRASASAS